MNFATSEPKASIGQIEAIKHVISLMKVQNLKIAKPSKRSGSSDSLASGSPMASSHGPLALCDGPCDGKSSCFVQVESLQEKLAAMQSLRMEIEAQN